MIPPPVGNPKDYSSSLFTFGGQSTGGGMKRLVILSCAGLLLALSLFWTHSASLEKKALVSRLEAEYQTLTEMLGPKKLGKSPSNGVFKQVNDVIGVLGLTSRTLHILPQGNEIKIAIGDLTQEDVLTFLEALARLEGIGFQQVAFSKNNENLIQLSLVIHEN